MSKYSDNSSPYYRTRYIIGVPYTIVHLVIIITAISLYGSKQHVPNNDKARCTSRASDGSGIPLKCEEEGGDWRAMELSPTTMSFSYNDTNIINSLEYGRLPRALVFPALIDPLYRNVSRQSCRINYVGDELRICMYERIPSVSQVTNLGLENQAWGFSGGVHIVFMAILSITLSTAFVLLYTFPNIITVIAWYMIVFLLFMLGYNDNTVLCARWPWNNVFVGIIMHTITAILHIVWILTRTENHAARLRDKYFSNNAYKAMTPLAEKMRLVNAPFYSNTDIVRTNDAVDERLNNDSYANDNSQNSDSHNNDSTLNSKNSIMLMPAVCFYETAFTIPFLLASLYVVQSRSNMSHSLTLMTFRFFLVLTWFAIQIDVEDITRPYRKSPNNTHPPTLNFAFVQLITHLIMIITFVSVSVEWLYPFMYKEDYWDKITSTYTTGLALTVYIATICIITVQSILNILRIGGIDINNYTHWFIYTVQFFLLVTRLCALTLVCSAWSWYGPFDRFQVLLNFPPTT